MKDFTLVISHGLSSLEGGFDRSDIEAYDFPGPSAGFLEEFCDTNKIGCVILLYIMSII